jgi:excisionase family DNA binding protein
MMLSPKAAAERIGVSASLIYQLCGEGVLRHFRFGGKNKRGRIRIEDSEVERYRQLCLRDPAELLPSQLMLKHLTLE